MTAPRHDLFPGPARSRRHWVVFGAAFAILLCAAGTRSAAGVPVDVTDSHRPAFLLAGIACLLAAAGVMWIDPRQPQLEPVAGTIAPVGSRS